MGIGQLTFVFFKNGRRLKVRSRKSPSAKSFHPSPERGPVRGIAVLVERGRSATGVSPSATSTVAGQSSTVEAKKVLEKSQSKKLAAKVAWGSGQRRGTQLADEGGEGRAAGRMPAQPEKHVEEASAAIECAEILSMLAKSTSALLPKARAVRGPGKGKQHQPAPEPPLPVDELQTLGVPAPPPIVKSFAPSFPTIVPEDGPPQPPPGRRRPAHRAPARPAAMVAPPPPEQVTLPDHPRYGRQSPDKLQHKRTPQPAVALPWTTLEVTQGQILSQSPTDATSSRWHLYGS